MKCKLKIDLKNGDKVRFIIRPVDTVVIDGAYIKVFESRDDDSTAITKLTWAEVKKIKITEV